MVRNSGLGAEQILAAKPSKIQDVFKIPLENRDRELYR